MPTRAQIRRWMWFSLNYNESEFVDSAGEVQYTKLAEDAALAHDRAHWIDDEMHWVWDVAIEVGEAWAKG